MSDKRSLQLVIPINLFLPIARQWRKQRLYFKRIRKGHWQLVRRLYSVSELATFRLLAPTMNNIETIIYDDVHIVPYASDSVIVIDKNRVQEDFEQRMKEYREEAMSNLFKSLSETNPYKDRWFPYSSSGWYWGQS